MFSKTGESQIIMSLLWIWLLNNTKDSVFITMLTCFLNFTGKNVLHSEFGFSKLYIDPKFDETDIPNYL